MSYRLREGDREKQVFYTRVYSPDGHMTRAGLGARACFRVSHTGGRNPSTWFILCCYSRHITRELDWMWSSQDLNQLARFVKMLVHINAIWQWFIYFHLRSRQEIDLSNVTYSFKFCNYSTFLFSGLLWRCGPLKRTGGYWKPEGPSLPAGPQSLHGTLREDHGSEWTDWQGTERPHLVLSILANIAKLYLYVYYQLGAVGTKRFIKEWLFWLF